MQGSYKMYGFSTIVDTDFETTITRVTEELQKEGFGVLTEIDVKATFKKKLDIDRKPYHILGACNPVLANKAIESEPEIGLLLPCNVLVRVSDTDDVIVSFMDPETVLGLVQSDAVKELGGEVKSRLLRVKDALSA